MDITKKRRKGSVGSGEELRDLQLGTDVSDLSFWTYHPETPCLVDFSEFATGVEAAPRPFTKKRLFSGRPALARQLVVQFRLLYGSSPRTTVVQNVCGLRRVWAFLDRHHAICPVQAVEDVTETLGGLQFREGMKRTDACLMLRLVNLARAETGLDPVVWPTVPNPTKILDTVDAPAVKLIYQCLKRICFGTVDRHLLADEQAAEGTDWSRNILERTGALNLNWTDAEIHATYRGLARASDHPCPNIEECVGLLGVSRGAGVIDPISKPILGLFLSRFEVKAFFHMFVLQSGWNPATALMIDLEGHWYEPHPTSLDHHIVRAKKERGKTIQVAIGQNKATLSPGRIIQYLEQRTKPLRDALRKELMSLQEDLQANPVDQTLLARSAYVRRAIRSPWLSVDPKHKNVIAVLEQETYSRGSASTKEETFLATIGKTINGQGNGRLIEKMPTLGDLRDAFIEFAFRSGNYDWLIASLAAGHDWIGSTVSYLRKRQYRTESHKKVILLQEVMIEEISKYKVLDAAILWARVQRGEITEQQRARWLADKDKSRCGTGCQDFAHPPPEIAPHHVDGHGCRVQRCLLCKHAVVLDSSVEFICRRYEELAFLRSEVPLASWLESSFPLEMKAAQVWLTKFNPTEVKKFRTKWRTLIQTGDHRPPMFDGEYFA